MVSAAHDADSQMWVRRKKVSRALFESRDLHFVSLTTQILLIVILSVGVTSR